MPYVKSAVYRRLYAVSNDTLKRWADEGKIDYRWSEGGIRMYRLPEGAERSFQNPDKQSVTYIRVSSAKQKDDLERQRAYMASRFPDNEIVCDIGSGINWKRKGLLSLLDRAHKGELREIVVASRDRLCRFAFDLLEHVFKTYGVKLRVLDGCDLSLEEELSEDLMSIVQVFCCRRNGRRRYGTNNDHQDAKNKTESYERAEGNAQEVC